MTDQSIPTTIRGLTLRKNLPFSLPELEDITDQLPKHPIKKWGRRKFHEVKRLIVHHMASEAPLVNQAKYHVNAHDWAGIAYNLVVSDGRLLQVNDLLAYTTHARGANDDSIGISIRGDLSKREMTTQERELLYAGILTVKEIWPNIGVFGHNEVSKTACPCTSMNRIRQDIATIELKMSVTATPNDVKSTIFKLRTRFEDIYNRSTNNNDPYQKEAQRKLLAAYEDWTEKNIL